MPNLEEIVEAPMKVCEAALQALLDALAGK
jgi:hypothetical protein